MDDKALARFYRKILCDVETRCWVWTAGTFTTGYGMFTFGSYPYLAHRASYQHFVGPVPDGLELDHLCRNTLCVNPDHLEAVTHSMNCKRERLTRTHCPSGHPYTEENTYTWRNERMCRTCRRERMQIFYLRRKARPD